MNRMKQVLISFGAGVLTFIFLFTNLFYGWDKLVSDTLCQTGEVADSRIFIVAIDDKTLEKYGPMNQWSREIFSQVVQALNKDAQKKPAVIAFDIMYIEETDEAVDAEFAKTCVEAGNVVTAFNLQFKPQPETNENGGVFINQFHIDEVDLPMEVLRESVTYGYANTVVDEDGYVRRFMPEVTQDGVTYLRCSGEGRRTI